MDIQKVLVTGSEGRMGRVMVQDLRARGYQVASADKASPSGESKIVDCLDLGQVIGVMNHQDAVIHLAAIPSPDGYPSEVVFRNNVISTFNILEAAAILGIKNVVIASSISALGTVFKFRHFNPQGIPVDEAHPLLAQDAYGLSKIVGEELASGFCRRIPDLALTSLRFSIIIDGPVRAMINRNALAGEAQENYAGIFWTYVDVRDAAASCRLAMEANQPGHEAYYIAAPRIFLDDPVDKLLAKYYPGDYPVAAHIRGHVSPVDCSKAERMLGWKALYDWEGNLL